MSRSNAPAGAAGPSGAQRQQHAAEQDLHGRRPAQGIQGRWPPQQPAPQLDPGYPTDDGFNAPPPGYATRQPPRQEYRQEYRPQATPARGDQARGDHGGYADPAFAPQAAPPYPRSSPFPAPRPPQPLPYPEAYPQDAGAPHGYAPAPAPGGYGAPQYDYGYGQDPRHDPREQQQQPYGNQQAGYDQWSGQQADPRGYDLASFGAPGSRGGDAPVGRAEFGLRAPAQEQQDWAQGQGHEAYANTYDDGRHGHQQAYGGPQDYDNYPPQHGAPHQHGDADVGYDEPPEEPEVDEGRSGRRGLMIVGALVGAIALGGGLAYGYKQFGGGKNASRPPIVKAEKTPAKTKPVEQGGKEFAHADKKLMERLDESRGAAVAAAAPLMPDRPMEKDESGALKVRTIPVGRDGAMASPPPVAQMPQQPAPAIPGLVLDGSLSSRSAPPPPPEPRLDSRPAMPATAAAPPAQRPVIANKIAAAAPEAAPAAPARAPVRQPLVRDDAAAPAAPQVQARAAPPATKPSAVGAGGYVAVVSSQKSRMEALKSFADLQQRYGGVLQGKTPDVQEANLGQKGVWFRAVVGPPGSREAAGTVCSQLKTAGYSGCWVGTY